MTSAMSFAVLLLLTGPTAPYLHSCPHNVRYHKIIMNKFFATSQNTLQLPINSTDNEHFTNKEEYILKII